MNRPDSSAYVLFLSLDQFYVRHFAPPGDQTARAVSRGRWIVDATDAARSLGALPGTPLVRARTYLAGQGVIHEWQDALGLAAQREWLDSAAAHCGVIEPLDQHAAWLDLSAHPDPIWVAKRIVADVANAASLPLRCGSARVKWLARKAAEVEGTQLTPMTAEELGSLPVHELEPVEEKMRERLGFLGCRRIRDVVDLPLSVLTKNFGPHAMAILQAAKGGLVEDVQAVYPPGVLRECVHLDGLTSDASALTAALERLARALGERLQRSALSAVHLSAQIEFEEQAVCAKRTFRKPVHDVRSVLHALSREVLPIITEPVAAVRIELGELNPAQLVQQHLENARSSPRARQDRVDVALHQMLAAFGDQAIARASELEEPWRVKVLRAWGDALGWR